MTTMVVMAAMIQAAVTMNNEQEEQSGVETFPSGGDRYPHDVNRRGTEYFDVKRCVMKPDQQSHHDHEPGNARDWKMMMATATTIIVTRFAGSRC